MHCTKCQHEWLGELIVDAPIKLATASMREVRCPSCGAGPKGVAFGRGHVPEPEPARSVGMRDSERRAEWLRLRDNGLSSQCIADRMCGLTTTGDHPHDGDDFGRCERLLALYPEWRARLGEMACVNVYWAALVPKWAEIAEAWRHDINLYRREPRAKDGWRCYPLMRSILDSIEDQDRNIIRLGAGITMSVGR